MTSLRPILYRLITLLFISNTAFAFPHGCESSGFGFNDPYVIFNDTGRQTFFLIQNHSDIKIELQRVETEDTFMSPKLRSNLNPDKWSAFASDTSDVHFQCLTYSNEKPIRINCRETLTICQYPRAKFALSNMGSYWVSTNKPQKQVIRDSIKKGILLRW
ncbi:MAG: enhanced entry protein EnhB [Gammaproteobacteria bacterium]|nr:enhanced entry protein EnhB [Gammaproteobacteria bacterium]